MTRINTFVDASEVDALAARVQALEQLHGAVPPPDPGTDPPLPDPGTDLADPPDVGAHPYYYGLKAHPNFLTGYSMRTKAQLDIEVRGPGGRPDPAYDQAMDAAKFVVPGHAAGTRGVRFPIPTSGRTSLLVTWEMLHAEEWLYQPVADGATPTHIVRQKALQLGRKFNNRWWEIDHNFKRKTVDQAAVYEVECRTYGIPGENMTDRHPVKPFKPFPVYADRWTRSWLFVEVDVETDFERVWLWMADANRPAQVIVDGLLCNSVEPVEKFWFQFGSSQSIRAGADLPCWARNWAVLADMSLADTMTVLERTRL